MITEESLYWITRLDHIHQTLCTLSMFSGLGLILGCILSVLAGFGVSENLLPKQSLYILVIPILSLLMLFIFPIVGTFIPTTKEAYIVYGVPALVKNQKKAIEQAEKVPEKVMKILNSYLDSELQEKKPE